MNNIIIAFCVSLFTLAFSMPGSGDGATKIDTIVETRGTITDMVYKPGPKGRGQCDASVKYNVEDPLPPGKGWMRLTPSPELEGTVTVLGIPFMGCVFTKIGDTITLHYKKENPAMVTTAGTPKGSFDLSHMLYLLIALELIINVPILYKMYKPAKD